MPNVASAMGTKQNQNGDSAAQRDVWNGTERMHGMEWNTWHGIGMAKHHGMELNTIQYTV